MKGMLIAVEGLDGSGKTGTVEKLHDYFKAAGLKVIRTREPGGTPLAERLRDSMKYGFYGLEDQKLSPMTLALLMNAARADHLEKVVRPYIKDGYIVITDRFVDSTLAYQGGAGGVDLGVLRTIHHLAHDGLYPDLTLLMDGDPNIFASRMCSRGRPDALDVLQTTKAERMREVFMSCYRMGTPQSYRLIKADLPEENVWAQVRIIADNVISARSV